jgi:UBA/TS-N domain
MFHFLIFLLMSHDINLLSAQQLQDMGFTNASQNIRALLATSGTVHAAIEYILGGSGL